MKKIVSVLTLLLSIHFTQAQDFSNYRKEVFIQGADTLRYRMLYPENYKKRKRYPLVVFLHGAGERGNDNEHQLDLGASLFLSDSVRHQFPAFVIFPQCPTDSTWNKFITKSDTTEAYNRTLNSVGLTTSERLVKQLMDSLVDHKLADKKRMYIGGLSLGGFGTYDLVIHYPDYFAAAFSICGQANVNLYTKKAGHVPLWIFHGAIDNVIPVQPNRDLYQSLQKKGAKQVKYTEYAGVMHNSWINAFVEPSLLPWLFSFKK
ncbi:prolyl oligopeptidase family serine peptidase [Spirosoma sp. HMF4905]|uniref:Prolyl oligopeptidase family serine peptidase n=1 Tax=Spirosoma arboris TaxID=2682092 RepID=A0A7K1SJN0_9BACT|nr:prolyl oligopeptidase family serine peptidase [Spirosoma arboris]MVM34017.1 prolyl oligopeptidase family serine peptidase [Spirosoma arboris]